MFYATGFIGAFYLVTFVLGFAAQVIVGRAAIKAADKGGNMAAPLLAEAVGGTPFLGFISAVAFATILAVVAGLTLSGAAARLVDLVRVGERAVRVRAGKIDAVFHAEAIIKEMISKWSSVSPATAVKSSRKYPSTTASKSNGSHPA